MKKMMTGNLKMLLLVILSIVIFGCGGSSTSGTGGTKEDLVADFGKPTASANLKASVIVIPDNLKVTSVSSSGKKVKSKKEDSIGLGIYGAIREFVNFSDFLKKSVEDLLVVIIDSKILLTAELDTLLPINDGSDLTGIKVVSISNVDGGKYDWKLSFYFKNETSPKMIFRLKFVDDKVKGEMIAQIEEKLSIEVDGQSTNLDRDFLIDISFDGTSTIQKLDIDFTQDISSLMTFGETNWAKLNDDQKEELDLSQPSKFSLRVQFDGSAYGISGSAYSPGAHLENTLSGEDEILDENRSTYTFRAKSITGDVDGAKMDIALPVDTLSNISSIWENDSFSAVFRAKLLNELNIALNKLVDSTDDVDEDATDDVDFSGSTIEEQKIGWQTLYWMLGDQLPIATLTVHGSVFSEAEFSAAQSFWGPALFTENNILTLTDLNNFMVSSDTTDTQKQFGYYYVMAPAIISVYQTTPVALTLTQLDAIVNKSDDNGDNVFKSTFQTLSHLVNPAFFEKEKGFLGTFDGTNFYSYDKETNSLSLDVKPTNFDSLNALDLTTLAAIKPNDVYTLVIELK